MMPFQSYKKEEKKCIRLGPKSCQLPLIPNSITSLINYIDFLVLFTCTSGICVSCVPSFIHMNSRTVNSGAGWDTSFTVRHVLATLSNLFLISSIELWVSEWLRENKIIFHIWSILTTIKFTSDKPLFKRLHFWCICPPTYCD